MTGKILSRLRTQGRDERGTAVVEFVIALPLLFLMMFAIIEFSLLFFMQNHMLNAARETARRMAVAGMNETQAEALAGQLLYDWNVNFTINASEPNPADPNDVNVSVFISAPFSEASILDYSSLIGDGNLEVVAIMRREE